jgi:predicted nuclease of predicted toxin-antitoxin system
VRILLDHCVPVDLAPHIRGHDVASVRDKGWQELNDGELLDAMTGQFDVLLTVDAGIPFQQLIRDRPFSVVILRAKSNRVGELARLIPAVLKTLKDIEPGDVREIAGR